MPKHTKNEQAKNRRNARARAKPTPRKKQKLGARRKPRR